MTHRSGVTSVMCAYIRMGQRFFRRIHCLFANGVFPVYSHRRYITAGRGIATRPWPGQATPREVFCFAIRCSDRRWRAPFAVRHPRIARRAVPGFVALPEDVPDPKRACARMTSVFYVHASDRVRRVRLQKGHCKRAQIL